MRIWSARVDSVHTDAYSTLSLLHNSNQQSKQKKGKDEGELEGEEGDGEEEKKKPQQKQVFIKYNESARGGGEEREIDMFSMSFPRNHARLRLKRIWIY